MSLASLATHTADIERKSTTASSYGGHTDSFSAVYDDIAGSFQPLRGELRERFARMGIDVSHVFYTATSVTTQAGDRLVISGVNYPIGHSENMAGRSRGWAVYVRQTD
jgi:hypothetical protein